MLHRRNFGEAVENLTGSSEYHWMAGNFLKYAGPLTVNDLPVDAHQLVALCAPRPVFISSGDTLGEIVAFHLGSASSRLVDRVAVAAGDRLLVGPADREVTVDGFVDEDVDYALRLNRAGVPTELHVYPGACHGYQIAVDSDVARRAERDKQTFLARWT